jgi:hypothetical protein
MDLSHSGTHMHPKHLRQASCMHPRKLMFLVGFNSWVLAHLSHSDAQGPGSGHLLWTPPPAVHKPSQYSSIKQHGEKSAASHPNRTRLLR